MGYYAKAIMTSTDKDVMLGRKIYMEALSGRRGFRDDHLGIDDAEIWIDIFESIASKASKAIKEEGE